MKLRIGILLLLAACAGGCAGWQVGTDSLYPSHIRTVHVPIFESGSFRRGLGEALTEAVCKEIELVTPYKVTGDPRADSILKGRLVRDSKRILIRSLASEPREYEVNLYVEVTWVDNTGRAIGSRAVALPPDMLELVGSSNIIPQTGKSTVVGQQEAMQRIATQIVSLMEAPW